MRLLFFFAFFLFSRAVFTDLIIEYDNGRHKFRNKNTGEIVEYNEAKPNEFGHKGHPHYHRPNPKKTGDHNKYLDEKRNPIGKHHEKSHHYHPDHVWWQ